MHAASILFLIASLATPSAADIFVTEIAEHRLPVYSDRPLHWRSRMLIALPTSEDGAQAPPATPDLDELPAQASQEPAQPLIPDHLVSRPAPSIRLNPAEPAMMPSRSQWTRRTALLPLIGDVSRRFRIDRELMQALIDVESRYLVTARSPKGAVGLMQVLPATAARFGNFDLKLPEQNLEAGARYLRHLLDTFHGDVVLALAAYNAGEAAVMKFGNRVPPYPETQGYVEQVLMKYRFYRAESARTADR